MIFKPSQIMCMNSVLPLCGSRFGRAKLEFAAAILVRACVRNGDTWGPRTREEVTAAWVQELDGGIFAHLARNPFAPQPDFNGLIDDGFALFVANPAVDALTTPGFAESIQFTAQGFAALEPFRAKSFDPPCLVGGET